MSENIRPWQNGQRITPGHLNEQVGALRKLFALPGAGVADGRRGRRPFAVTEILIGKVVTAGPAGEANYADERYWVRETYVAAAATSASPLALNNEPARDATDTLAAVAPVRTVTNPAEAVAHTHLLPAGTPVVFVAFRDATSPAPLVRYVMAAGAGPAAAPTPNGTSAFRVALSVTNPSAEGSPTTAAAFTYDVYSVSRNPGTGVLSSSGTLISVAGTPVAPDAPRWNGRRVPATRGLAQYVDGQLYLLEAWETLGTNQNCAAP